jgi:hypothetical protein
MYVFQNYRTKKEFKTAVLSGIKHEIYNPSGMFPVPQNGRVSVEGPHYPEPHRWYATAIVENGVVIKVVS